MADKTLFQNEWAHVIDRDGYTVVETPADAVAVLPWRVRDDITEGLFRWELCPARGPGYHLTVVTGMQEPGERPIATALRELHEETGLSCRTSRMASSYGNSAHLSKLTDTVVHMFTPRAHSDWDEEAPLIVPGDGSSLEEHASNEWLSFDDALSNQLDVLGHALIYLALEVKASYGALL